MQPTLGFLLLTRDILQDVLGGELTAVRIFDTLIIPADEREIIYPVHILGRLYLNQDTVFPSVQAKLRIIDPDGEELGNGQLLTGANIQGNIVMNLICRSWTLTFNKAGRYKVDVSVSTDGGTTFTPIESPLSFTVVKLT